MTCPLVKPTSGYRTFSRLVSLRVRPSICTSTEVSLATFAHDLFGGLVIPEALECRRPKLSGLRPFHELELTHDLGFHEMRRAARRPDVECARLPSRRLQHLVDLFVHVVR